MSIRTLGGTPSFAPFPTDPRVVKRLRAALAVLVLTLAGLTATAAPASAQTCYLGSWNVVNSTPNNPGAYYAVTWQYGTGPLAGNCTYRYDAYQYPYPGSNYELQNVGAMYIGRGWCAWVRSWRYPDRYALIDGDGNWITQAMSPGGDWQVEVVLGRHWVRNSAGRMSNCW